MENILLKNITKFLILIVFPIVLLVQLSGTSSVGGGFPAGCILGSILIFLLYRNVNLQKIKYLIFFNILGILIYLICYLLPLLLNYNLMDYNAFNILLQIFNLPRIGEKIGIIFAEIGVCLVVANSFSIIYFHLK
ncbi:MAG: MnhB domain-containing protein [Rickettsiales bacterium]